MLVKSRPEGAVAETTSPRPPPCCVPAPPALLEPASRFPDRWQAGTCRIPPNGVDIGVLKPKLLAGLHLYLRWVGFEVPSLRDVGAKQRRPQPVRRDFGGDDARPQPLVRGNRF